MSLFSLRNLSTFLSPSSLLSLGLMRTSFTFPCLRAVNLLQMYLKRPLILSVAVTNRFIMSSFICVGPYSTLFGSTKLWNKFFEPGIRLTLRCHCFFIHCRRHVPVWYYDSQWDSSRFLTSQHLLGEGNCTTLWVRHRTKYIFQNYLTSFTDNSVRDRYGKCWK